MGWWRPVRSVTVDGKMTAKKIVVGLKRQTTLKTKNHAL
jgi:hypothetical protein